MSRVKSGQVGSSRVGPNLYLPTPSKNHNQPYTILLKKHQLKENRNLTKNVTVYYYSEGKIIVLQFSL